MIKWSGYMHWSKRKKGKSCTRARWEIDASLLCKRKFLVHYIMEGGEEKDPCWGDGSAEGDKKSTLQV